MSDNSKILAVVDDHPLLIEGLRSLLKDHAEFGEVHSFTTGQAFMRFLENCAVDTVLLDITLPDASGIELCKEIKEQSPDTIVLGLSSQAERSIILQMLTNGAGGYLLKSATADELLACIEEAQYGNIVFSSEVKKIMAKPAARVRSLPSVTKREKQMLQLLAEGKTTAMIADELSLSRFTVDTYRKNLLQKFEVKNISELLVMMVREGLL